MALAGVSDFIQSGENLGLAIVGLVVLPIGVAHYYYAAKNVREGKAWGRTMSGVIAAAMLFGVPIGTAIAIYIFMKTGESWQSGTA